MQSSVIILSSTPGRGSGAERVLEYLLGSDDIRPLIAAIIAPPQSSVATFAAGLGYHVMPWRAEDSLLSGLRATADLLRNYCVPEGARILHAWHTRGFEFALAMARHWGLEATGTLHDHPAIRRHSWPRRRLIRLAGSRLHRMAVASEALKDVCAAAGWSVPMTTIPNGLPDGPRSTALHEPVLRVGFVGLNARWKGIDLLASAALETRDLPLRWQLYGEPSADVLPISSKLQRALPDRVTARGFRPASEIFADLAILFHPSTEFDPFPTALLEAARAGVPAIASDIGGSSEIVENHVTGELFDCTHPECGGIALRRLCENRSHIVEMGESARQRFELKFSLALMAKDYIQFWR